MSAWRCFEYRLVLWCSSFLGYVNCCSLPSGSLSIAYCLTLQRPTANCSLLPEAVPCPGGRAQPCCVLVDVSCSLYAFNHRGSEARCRRWMLCGHCASQQQPWYPHCLQWGLTSPPPREQHWWGRWGCPPAAADAEKLWRWVSPCHKILLGIFFLLFVKDNVIIIIPWKRKRKKKITLKYI